MEIVERVEIEVFPMTAVFPADEAPVPVRGAA